MNASMNALTNASTNASTIGPRGATHSGRCHTSGRRGTVHRSQRFRSLKCRAVSSSQSGFSLLEVLIASVILLLIALGIVPLFIRATGQNQEGRFASVASSIASSELERLLGVPFNAPDMTVPVGDVEILREQYQLEMSGEWIDLDDWTPEDGFVFHRIIRVRQFALGALADGILNRAESINGSVSDLTPGLVQIKEILVQVESGSFPGASSKQVSLRSIRGV